MEDIIKSIKALSDETRLRILNVVLERECCVCEVTQALNITQTRASRNLSMLRDAGFLTLRKEGLWTLYSISNKAKTSLQSKLIEAIKEDVSLNKKAKKDMLRLQTAMRSPYGCYPYNSQPDAKITSERRS